MDRQAAQRKATAASSTARHREALAAYKGVLPLIARLRAKGMSLGHIADHLNACGRTTRTGKRWHPVQVLRVLERARKEANP
jgi:hypothetical protein